MTAVQLHKTSGVQAPPSQATPRSSKEHAARFTRTGWWVILGAVVPIGLWLSFAALSMAVVAQAFVKVDLNRRPVQHLEGGIVHSVLVRDGQTVQAGEPILMLGDVGVEADRNRIAYRVSTEQAAIARLEAEENLRSTLVFPADLLAAAGQDERIHEALAKETSLFNARRDSLSSEVALMRAQRERVDQEIVALVAQVGHAQMAKASHAQELQAHRRLRDEGFISPTKLIQLEAAQSDYSLKMEERRSELARAQQRRLDNELKIKSITNTYSRTASDQIKVTAARLTEIEQERRKSDDASLRQIVRAPAAGTIIDLKFTSPGAVVGPGEVIAEIVPSDARLMIEAHVRPEEINNVQLDQFARIRFTAFKLRNASFVTGKVTYISADRLIDKANNAPYYSVMILADPQSIEAAGKDLHLQAGMPAEVFIDGSTQTPLQYVSASITSAVRRAGRQM
ncbi:MAG: HlyD family type I secretion periplasmic adaptor subunit [Burkholderiaceae bacterium]